MGTDIETTNEFTKLIEGKVIKVTDPYRDIVASVITNVGSGTSDPNDFSSVGQSQTPHKARITVNFVEFRFRGEVKTSDVMSEIRDGIAGYPGVTLTVDKIFNAEAERECFRWRDNATRRSAAADIY